MKISLQLVFCALLSGRTTAFSSLLVLLIGLLGCSQKDESQADDSLPGHPLVGVIKSIDAEYDELTVHHEDIPGFMPAMTMVFKVGPGDTKNAKEGQAIRARMVRDEDGGFRLIDIWPLDEDASKDLKAANKKLQKQIKQLPKGRYLGEGDVAPEFGLLDQYGKVVTKERLEGKIFAMNFIFSRCPDPSMCPLSTSKMVTLQRKVAEAGIENVAFVSVTLDPKFDTPGVLREYADLYGADGSNFHFVTGPIESVESLIKAMGITALEGEDTIIHSMATSLIDPDGNIILRADGKAWSMDAFYEKIVALSKGGGSV